MNQNVTLICKSVWYYSTIDEDVFFEWISRVKSIIKFDGIKDELYLYFDNKNVVDDDLRELLALFYRYKIDMKQLQCFLNKNNKEWFCDNKKAYWHKRVFGAKAVVSSSRN